MSSKTNVNGNPGIGNGNGVIISYSGSSDTAVQAFNTLKELLNAEHVSNGSIKSTIQNLQTQVDNGAVVADLAAGVIPLLEQAMEAKGVRGNTVGTAKRLRAQLVWSSKVQEFEGLVNNFGNLGVHAKILNKNIIETTNSVIEQAQADFNNEIINSVQLTVALHTALDEGIESINSAIQEAEDAALAQENAGTEKVTPGLAKKEELPPGSEEKVVSMNQMAVTGSEAVRADTTENKSKRSKNVSAIQNSHVGSVALGKSAIDLFRKAVADVGLKDNCDTNQKQEQSPAVEASINILA